MGVISMKRSSATALAFFGAGVVFSVLSAEGRPGLLAVGIVFYVIGGVLLVRGRRSGVE